MEEKLQISLAAARVNAKLTQEDVAKELHVSKRTIVNWESGKIKPEFAVMQMLCRLYDIPANNIRL